MTARAQIVAAVALAAAVTLPCRAQTSAQLTSCIRDLDSGDADKVIENCTQAIGASNLGEQNLIRALNNRGIAYQSKRDFDRAIADFTRVLGVNPNDDTALNNRAAVHMQRGDWDHAITDLTEALRLHPDYAIARKNRGDSRLNKGMYAEAVDDYNHALQVDPEDTEALKSRGALHFFLGQFGMAAEDLAREVALDPEDTYSAIWLYIAQARAGSGDRAALTKSASLPGADGWPAAIGRMLVGKITPAELTRIKLDSGPDPDNDLECEMNFYLGEQALIAQKQADAVRFFRAAVATGAKANLEYKAAEAELRRTGNSL